MVLIEQDQLIEEHGPEGQQLAAAQALNQHLPVPLKEVFEQAVERFNGLGAQIVKYASDFNATISMGICAPTRGYNSRLWRLHSARSSGVL
jgi:hypothetical protein